MDPDLATVIRETLEDARAADRLGGTTCASRGSRVRGTERWLDSLTIGEREAAGGVFRGHHGPALGVGRQIWRQSAPPHLEKAATLGKYGAWFGALKGRFIDCGLNDELIKSLGSTVEPSSSAVFLLVGKVVEDEITPRLSQYEAKALKTSLSDEQEEKLKAALSKAA